MSQGLQPPFALYLNADLQVFLPESDLMSLKSDQSNSISLRLLSSDDWRDLGKTITVKYGEKDGPTGLYLEKIDPTGKFNWNSIIRFNLTITERAYCEIIQQGLYSSRCNGENKVVVVKK